MPVRLVEERRKRRWTQKHLANLIGLYDVSTVSRWEAQQRRPYPRNAVKLEALFNLTVDELLSPTPEMKSGDTRKDAAAVTAIRQEVGQGEV